MGMESDCLRAARAGRGTGYTCWVMRAGGVGVLATVERSFTTVWGALQSALGEPVEARQIVVSDVLTGARPRRRRDKSGWRPSADEAGMANKL